MTQFIAADNVSLENNSDLRTLQLVELQILKEFIRICEEHGLKYYVIGGTALGAVRHKGFIPWDDDIDVSMPRKDYNKFFEIADASFKYNYEIRTMSNYKDHLHPFMQIVDKRVKLFITKANFETSHNAYMDIFPADGLPNSKLIRFFHVYLFLVYKCFFHISVFNERVNQEKTRPVYEKLIIKFCNKYDIQKLFNKKKRVAAADKLLSKYDFYKKKYCSLQLWGQYKTKAVFPTKWIGEGARLPFEDIEVVVPSNCNAYLTQLYGTDYMELPPVEKRSTHSSKIIFDNDTPH